MELKELQKLWEENGVFQSKTRTYYELDILPKLCRKAQELIWDCAWEYKNYYLQVINLDEELLDMTPIEQVFFIANDIFIYKMMSNVKTYIKLNSQETISVFGKNYRPDFIVKEMMVDDVDFELKKQVIIECDGYNYHSSKQQRNNDIERENNLKMAGYSIIRFTGTQIHNNPYLCVMQALKFVYDENKDCIEEYIKQENEEIKKVLGE